MFVIDDKSTEIINRLWALADTTNPPIASVIELADICSTINIEHDYEQGDVKVKSTLIRYGVYWEFLDAMLQNIEIGHWGITPPAFWFEHAKGSDINPLTDHQVDVLRRRYFSHRTDMLYRTGLMKANLDDKEIVYHWLMKPMGIYDMLASARYLVRMHTLLTINRKAIYRLDDN